MHPQSQKAGLLPSLKARAFYKGLSLAIAFCLVCPSMPVLAAESDEAALVHAEKILFGNEAQQGDFAERLVRVEKRIFGRKKNGSDEERVERITSTLLIDRKKLKVARKTEEKPLAAETSSDTKVERGSEPLEQAPASSASAELGEKTLEPAAPAPTTAKETVKEIAKQFGSEFAKDAALQPDAQVAREPAAAAKPVKGKNGKSKSKIVAKRGVTRPVTANNKSTENKPEVKLTAETAALDSRKVEKRPSALDNPVTYSSSSSNRISRGPSHKVSQAMALLREGMEAHKRGEEAKAEQLFKKVVLLEPRNPDGYFNLGALAEKKNDLAGALMSYRAALNLSPDDRELREAVESVESQLGVEIAGGSAPSRGSGHSSGISASASSPSSSSGGASDREAEEARRAEIREYYGRSSDREQSGREAIARQDSLESSDRFDSQPGSYGFGQGTHRAHNSHGGPQSAPNFYRARAKTTREIQEEAAPFVDVNDPNAPVLSVSPPPAPVSSTNQTQPFQLQTQRNQAAAQATQRKGPSAAGVATRAILGVALQVGTSYALRSAGLHCPVCRIGGGGGALRGLLRF